MSFCTAVVVAAVVIAVVLGPICAQPLKKAQFKAGIFLHSQICTF